MDTSVHDRPHLSDAMSAPVSSLFLVNGSAGDPVLYLDFPGAHNAVLFDAGDLAQLAQPELADVGALCLTHHHLDHLAGFDRLIRVGVNNDKTLNVFGPAGTIDRITKKLTSFAYARFPFMKLVVRLHEARFDSAGKPDNHDGPAWRVVERSVSDGFEAMREIATAKAPPKVWHTQREGRISGVPADHTVPCLAYVLEARAGYHFDREKAAGRSLKAGEWVGRALDALDAPKGQRPEMLDVDGHLLLVADLARQYFTKEPTRRYVFITDTLYSKALVARLTPLGKGATALFCDSYYSIDDLAKAKQHKHMTATHAAELAAALKVERLHLMHFAPRYKGRYQQLVDEAQAVFPAVTADLPHDRQTQTMLR